LVSDLDDVETSTARVNGKYLRYNSTKGKWEGADASGGGALSNIVEDTTPQLGGALDVNSKEIISVSNNNITFAPNGTGKVVFKGVSGNGGNGAGRFVLNCEQNSHGITIQGPPHSASANYTLTLPNTDGNADQVLKTNGSGVLDWVDQASGSSQNLFSTIAVSGQNNVVADSTTDTLTLVAGSNMTITTNASGDSITFAAAGGSSLSTEQVQDIVGAMFTGNTETNITATYQDSDGTIDLVATGGGGGGLSSRTTANAATSSIANNASANITITAAKTYALQKIQTSAAAWVTLYTDTTSRSNDSSRNETTDPTPGSGVIAEVITTGAATQSITPGLIGWNNDGTPSANVYLKVVNKSGSTQAITVTLHYVTLET